MSDFATWFVQQHGKRTDGGLLSLTDDELRGVARDGSIAEDALARRELWDGRRESALYAWNARNTDDVSAIDAACTQGDTK